MWSVPGQNLGLVTASQSDHTRYFSDHASLVCHLYNDKSSLTVKIISYWKIGDMNLLDNDLANSDFRSTVQFAIKEDVLVQVNAQSVLLPTLRVPTNMNVLGVS